MVVLLTNDDGYQVEGITTLEQCLSEAGHEVWVCAPSSERSAQSQAITVHGKVTIVRYDERHYHCSGTPADCVLYGLGGEALPIIPDVVVSGINYGYNASTDILYSGTVGAAREAALRGFPSIAISARSNRETGVYPFEETAKFLADNLEWMVPLCSSEVILNINVPPQPNGEWRLGMVGHLEYFDYVEKSSTKNKTSYDVSSSKIGLAYGNANTLSAIGEEVTLSLTNLVPPELKKGDPQADYLLLNQGYISVTPIVVEPVVHQGVAKVLNQRLKKVSGNG
ncbi:MAG: 5'/3'-nucleotidase SurE [Sphaerochaetaceae bacterium]|jgi:5'-nucleotidase|nr:5'/3'-nucleotidase SurE [Sphaerochaetaceae bacterium]HHU89279.1 5'/3'-nucleotidase SurE [Spirochaetales bacterium]